MQVKATPLDGVLILEPKVFLDERGFFLESWNRRAFIEATGVESDFVQDNQSGSKLGVLRGLHYQVPPDPQGKLVRVTVGSVFDVAVDLRRSSPTFGRWFGMELRAETQQQLWIPSGFAHGFMATSGWAEVHYKVTCYHSPSCERVLRWDDPEVGVEWPRGVDPLLSERDAQAVGLRDAEVFT